jgi:[protein-PII] uridylyltransferase
MSATLAITDQKSALKAARAALLERYLAKPNPQSLLRAMSRVTDDALKQLWTQLHMPKHAALVAVGGYGRGKLFPHSDVDVLVLFADSAAMQGATAAVEHFVTALWDCGIEAGHSVRTLDECATEASSDLTIATAMLEARHVCGDAALSATLVQQLAEQRDKRAFVIGKLEEQAKRHARALDVAYNLEPNIKESPGGLRDVQTALWLARALGMGDDISALAKSGLLSAQEATEFARFERSLNDLRIRLHMTAKRREDRLVFDHQHQLAADLGFHERVVSNADGKRYLRPSEQLMRTYYLAAKGIWRYNQILITELRERVANQAERAVRRIDDEFCAVGESLELIRDDVFQTRPGAMLDTFIHMQHEPKILGFGPTLLRSLYRALPLIDSQFRKDPANRERFMRFMQNERLTWTLRRMSRYGVLGRYLPVFGRIVGQMQHDLFHVYTVDEHTLMVIRNLRRFAIPRFNHEFPFCSELMQAMGDRYLLYIAALFHDIAKGRGGDHSELGAKDIAKFARDHGMQKADRQLVEFLVEHHLVMSSTAQKQDLSDPDVIAGFAAKVKTERNLIALYVLTVADVRGTSPTVWNAWKAKLLEDLLRATRALLRGETDYNEAWITSKRDEALRIVSQYHPQDDTGERDAVLHALWQKLGPRFFQRFEGSEIGWITRTLWSRVSPDKPIVRARLSPIGDGIQVMMYATDKEGLFARITHFFEKQSMEVLGAKVHTTLHGYALNTFQLMGRGWRVADYKDAINVIEHGLADAMLSEKPLPAPTKPRASRQLKHFPLPAQVHVRKGKLVDYFEISLVAADQPGLLSRVARVLLAEQVRLHDARVSTLGARAEDTFSVEAPALANAAVVEALKQQLTFAVDQG